MGKITVFLEDVKTSLDYLLELYVFFFKGLCFNSSTWFCFFLEFFFYATLLHFWRKHRVLDLPSDAVERSVHLLEGT